VIYLLTINYYSSDLIKRLLDSIKQTKCDNFKFIIVNNSPEDKDVNKLTNYAYVHILEAKNNLGFGGGSNLGLTWIYEQNPSALVWLINPDAYFAEDYLPSAQLFFLEYPEISILGTEVDDPSGNIWFASGEFIKKNGNILTIKTSLNYEKKAYFLADWVTGCSMLINFKKFNQCPNFDPDYFLYYEDVDFCQRYSKSGYLVAVTNKIKVIHQASSVTLKYGYLKLIHNIYSYLLTLEKHTNMIILIIRLLRINLVSFILLFWKPKIAVAKLTGIMMYYQRLIKLLIGLK